MFSFPGGQHRHIFYTAILAHLSFFVKYDPHTVPREKAHRAVRLTAEDHALQKDFKVVHDGAVVCVNGQLQRQMRMCVVEDQLG